MSKQRIKVSSFQDVTSEGWNPILYVDGRRFEDVAEKLGAYEGMAVTLFEADGDDLIEADAKLSWRQGASLLALQWVAIVDDSTIRNLEGRLARK